MVAWISHITSRDLRKKPGKETKETKERKLSVLLHYHDIHFLCSFFPRWNSVVQKNVIF